MIPIQDVLKLINKCKRRKIKIRRVKVKAPRKLKITEEIRQDILANYKPYHCGARELGRKHGVSYELVYQVIRAAGRSHG